MTWINLEYAILVEAQPTPEAVTERFGANVVFGEVKACGRCILLDARQVIVRSKPMLPGQTRVFSNKAVICRKVS